MYTTSDVDSESWKRKSGAVPPRQVVARLRRNRLSQHHHDDVLAEVPSVGKLIEPRFRGLCPAPMFVLRGSSDGSEAKYSLLRYLPAFPPSVESKGGCRINLVFGQARD